VTQTEEFAEQVVNIGEYSAEVFRLDAELSRRMLEYFLQQRNKFIGRELQVLTKTASTKPEWLRIRLGDPTKPEPSA